MSGWRFYKILSVVFVFCFLASSVFGATLSEESCSQYNKNISFVIRSMKDVYEPDEPVMLALAIANHGSESVYLNLYGENLDTYYDGPAGVEDKWGEIPSGASIYDPPPPPAHWYIDKAGKKVFVVPIFQIKGHSVVIVRVQDALKRFKMNMEEGIYKLDMGQITVIHEIEELIVRDDVEHRLWINPKTDIGWCHYKLDPINIQIGTGENLEDRGAPDSQSPAVLSEELLRLEKNVRRERIKEIGPGNKDSSGIENIGDPIGDRDIILEVVFKMRDEDGQIKQIKLDGIEVGGFRVGKEVKFTKMSQALGIRKEVKDQEYGGFTFLYGREYYVRGIKLAGADDFISTSPLEPKFTLPKRLPQGGIWRVELLVFDKTLGRTKASDTVSD